MEESTILKKIVQMLDGMDRRRLLLVLSFVTGLKR